MPFNFLSSQHIGFGFLFISIRDKREFNREKKNTNYKFNWNGGKKPSDLSEQHNDK